MIYLSRETIKLVSYNEVGFRIQNRILGGGLAFPVGNTVDFQFEFGDGVQDNTQCCFDVRRFRVGNWRQADGGLGSGGDGVRIEDIALSIDGIVTHGVDFLFRNRDMNSIFVRDDQNTDINDFVVTTNKGIDALWWMKGISEPDNLNVYLDDTFDDQVIISYPKLKFPAEEEGFVLSKTWTVELDFYIVSFNPTADMQFLRFGAVKLDIDRLSK